MAESEVEICNAALSRIGQSLLLSTDLPDVADAAAAQGTPTARQAALWYPRALEAALRRYRWPFAQARAQLAVVAGETRDGWDFVYAYPADCVKVHFVTVAGLTNPTPDQRAPTKIEARVSGGDVIGKLILCNEEDAEISYTRRVTNVATFDGDFEDALIWRVASDLARALIKGDEGRKLAEECLRWFEYAARVAIAAAAQEETDEPEPASTFERARS